MREIKFRVWDKETKAMYKVTHINLDLGEVCYKRKIMLDNNNIAYIDDREADLGDKKIILMQFTGLKDKNGKEIYEGDIIFCNGLYYVVFWDNINACWSAETDQIKKANELEVDGVFQLNEDEKEFYEVIGNIYENPELLKGDSK